MALTEEDLQAIASLTRAVVKEQMEPVNKRLDTMQADINAMQTNINDLKADVEQIKEDTTITRDVVNGVSEWTEIASDVLKIQYPLQKAK